MRNVKLWHRPARDRQILELWQRGESHAAIAAQFGLSSERVRQIVGSRMLGIQHDVPRCTHSDNQRERIITARKAQIKTLLQQGKTVGEIAIIVGISRGLVNNTVTLLRQDGILFSKKPKYGKIDTVVARRMRAAGATWRTIAHHFDVAASSVRNALAMDVKGVRYSRKVENYDSKS